jgi:hypothetical protein
MVWRRVVEFRRKTDRWTFETKSMSLGKMDVPRRFWTFVNRELGEVDQRFADDQRWVTVLPAIEIKTNAMNSRPELRLYTYPAVGTAGGPKP